MSDFKDVTTDQAFTKKTLYGRDGEMTYGGALSFLRRKYTKNLVKMSFLLLQNRLKRFIHS